MIRLAEISDLPFILKITNHTILNSHAIYEEVIWDEKKAKDWYDSKIRNGFPVFVYELEGKILGFSAYSNFRSRMGYRFTVEHSVYVLYSENGKGVGSELLIHLMEHAKKEGFKQMIGVIDAANYRSIEFHKKHGFIEAGVLKKIGNRFGEWLSVAFLQKEL